MKRIVALWLGWLLVVSTAAAQSVSGAQSKDEPALPYIPSLDITSMDKSVDPCVDLYHYACGGWQKRNPIPPDQTSLSVYGKLYQDNLMFLRGILEQAGATGSQRDANTQKIGDFYGSCMDESTADKRGVAAIQPQLDAIAGLKSARDMASLVGTLQTNAAGQRSSPKWIATRESSRAGVMRLWWLRFRCLLGARFYLL